MYKRNMQIQIEKKDKIIVLLIVLMFLEAINNVAVAGMQNTNALATQLSDCCCTTQRSIDAVRYESAQLFSHYGTACNNGCGC